MYVYKYITEEKDQMLIHFLTILQSVKLSPFYRWRNWCTERLGSLWACPKGLMERWSVRAKVREAFVPSLQAHLRGSSSLQGRQEDTHLERGVDRKKTLKTKADCTFWPHYSSINKAQRNPHKLSRHISTLPQWTSNIVNLFVFSFTLCPQFYLTLCFRSY